MTDQIQQPKGRIFQLAKRADETGQPVITRLASVQRYVAIFPAAKSLGAIVDALRSVDPKECPEVA